MPHTGETMKQLDLFIYKTTLHLRGDVGHGRRFVHILTEYLTNAENELHTLTRTLGYSVQCLVAGPDEIERLKELYPNYVDWSVEDNG